jgi:hypothetical protein
MSSALDVVIHLERAAHGRRVASIGVLVESASATAVVPAIIDKKGKLEQGDGWSALAARLDFPLSSAPGDLGNIGAAA